MSKNQPIAALGKTPAAEDDPIVAAFIVIKRPFTFPDVEGLITRATGPFVLSA